MITRARTKSGGLPVQWVEADARRFQRTTGQTVRVSGTNRYDPATQITIETTVRRWQDEQGEHVHRAPLALRFFEP